MIKVGSLQYGVIFKKAFSDPEIFKPFIDDFFGIDIQIEKVETEKSFDPPIGNVDCRFDLYAEDTVNRIVLDIQHVRHFDHYHRFLHYHSAALLDQIKSSRDYFPPHKVFTLVVLTSGDKHQKDIGIVDFDPKDLKGEPFDEIPHKIMFICPKYVNESTPEPYSQWMRAINDSLDEEIDETHYDRLAIQKIFQHIKRDDITPRERAIMIDEYSFGLLEKAAEEKGMKKGMEKGMEKGAEKAMEVMARKMLSAKQFSDQQISELTGFPIDSIKKLSLI
ncbi:hypothetical protein MHK_009354 [Candidatus Magnetomorum sp. HK-1]|nr:hypothetical protein MHK_009354 [Candidatus Magnetomorum sp. HK-1]